ncbi:MAG: threonine--tRNA ligase [candidate division Zixibacteria bacterium RBG_16_53_22]|nr:MAG: threonine--tRNA ligase [candidate division Zixibacteria bacterium RBG_16_53_22]
MSKIEIKLPDNGRREFDAPVTPALVAQTLSRSLALKALAAVVDGRVVDLNYPISKDSEVRILTWDDPQGREVFWHSSAHLMASAVLELFPDTKLAIGPAIPDDFSAKFYYDLDMPQKLTDAELEKIEKKMAEIVSRNLPFDRREANRLESIKEFRSAGDIYKAEMASEWSDETVSFYSHGNFTDMCRGPHLPSTGYIKAVKLLSVAGAYWRGDEKNKMLQRIYGVSFPERKMLDEHLQKIEEARKRDHRFLGRDLDLFSIVDDVGSGLVLWHPRGAMVRHIIEAFWKEEHLGNGYEIVYSPHIAKLDLWNTSGHTGFYAENMYSPMPIENVQYEIKPMNCPFHIQIYKSKTRSYRELPIRWAELGTVYRYERSGVLHGLMRVRGFTQDDAHIFCRPDQLTVEIVRTIEFNLFFLRTFGFEDYDVFLSTRPQKFVGTIEGWDLATEALRLALETAKLNYQVDPGEGVFYGPKIDIKIKDNLGRSWQCTTIQVDFNLPERFQIEYSAEDGTRARPIMIHRALLGSMERFFGILIEHYAGNFPVWLAPEQIRVLPVTDEAAPYAEKVLAALKGAGLRAQIDISNEKIGKKIRDAESLKVPYMAVVGKIEAAAGQVALRRHRAGDIGKYSLDQAIEMLKGLEAQKKID